MGLQKHGLKNILKLGNTNNDKSNINTMPINYISANLLTAFGTQILNTGLSNTQNSINFVRTHASDSNNSMAFGAFKIFDGGEGNKSVNNNMMLFAFWNPTPYQRLGDFMTAGGLNYNLYATIISNQINPYKELWAHTSNTGFDSPWVITRAPLIAQNGILIQGSTANTYAFYFDTTTKRLRFVDQTFSGTIIIQTVINVLGTGYLLRQYASSTDYVLYFNQGGTQNIVGTGHTINYIKKNGIEVNPQNSGELYTLFSEGFNLLEAKITLGSTISGPELNLISKIEEYVIYQG